MAASSVSLKLVAQRMNQFAAAKHFFPRPIAATVARSTVGDAAATITGANTIAGEPLLGHPPPIFERMSSYQLFKRHDEPIEINDLTRLMVHAKLIDVPQPHDSASIKARGEKRSSWNEERDSDFDDEDDDDGDDDEEEDEEDSDGFYGSGDDYVDEDEVDDDEPKTKRRK
ncbi:hypothetical protein Dimus_012647 [Dionaea muscipula]